MLAASLFLIFRDWNMFAVGNGSPSSRECSGLLLETLETPETPQSAEKEGESDDLLEMLEIERF